MQPSGLARALSTRKNETSTPLRSSPRDTLGADATKDASGVSLAASARGEGQAPEARRKKARLLSGARLWYRVAADAMPPPQRSTRGQFAASRKRAGRTLDSGQASDPLTKQSHRVAWHALPERAFTEQRAINHRSR
ncbi:hypothetical protein MRX96_001376 [Rhipicephalus microplus]